MSIPEVNRRAYEVIAIVEVALRELVICELERVDGPKWYKHRMSGDLLEKYRKGREYENRTSWSTNIPHHPLYYVDFPELSQIIVRRDTWREVFAPILGDREVLASTLRECEPVRNKIAHNRKVSSADLLVVEGALSKLEAALTRQRVTELIARWSTAPELRAAFESMKAEIQHGLLAAKEAKPLPSRATWHSASASWWFDEDYLGTPLRPIVEVHRLFDQYAAKRVGWGAGHLLLRWQHDVGLENAVNDAANLLLALVERVG